jgi:hypothetical protein
MLRHSAEVRWFYEGEAGDELLSWFSFGRPPAREPPRVDRYLRLPGCRGTSIKIREGKLEVKAQAGPQEAVRYADTISGLSDRWVKWSQKLPEVEPLLEANANETMIWTAVSKTRLARVVPVLSDAYCSMELVRITTHGHHWWSLALEVSGDPSHVAEGLARAAEGSLVAAPPPVKLAEADSYAYPVWLDLISSESSPTRGSTV